MTTDHTLLIKTEHPRAYPGVQRITLNRPEARNAFNNAMYVALARALKQATEDPAVRVIVLTGAGENFTAGQDLTEMRHMDTDAHTEKTTRADADSKSQNKNKDKDKDKNIGFDHLLDALMHCDKPIITAVHGAVLGLGLTMLLHTDLNFVAANARFKCPFVTLGVVPEAASSYLLPDIMGYGRAAEFLFTARWLRAEEAVASGIAVAIIPDNPDIPNNSETLDGAERPVLTHALKTAAHIATHPPAAVRATKRLLREGQRAAVVEARQRENHAFVERMASAEFREAMLAFAEKRPPNFDPR